MGRRSRTHCTIWVADIAPDVRATSRPCSTMPSRRPRSFSFATTAIIPEEAKEPDKWKLVVDGEVNKTLEITLGELKTKFRPVTRRMVLECGGNGRSFFTPQARGNQWTNGGAGCAEWTGVRLSDVLKAAGVKPSAVFTGHYGADRSLADNTKDAISRGVPIKKAMDENNLIVFAMNGQPLPNIHGGPVRLVIPGWPGSVSAKWFTRIWVRDKYHDGPGMGATSYRVAIKPMVPGDKPDERQLPRSRIDAGALDHHQPGQWHEARRRTRARLKLRGAAWAGDNTVKAVAVSTDFGATWHARQGRERRRTSTTGSAGPRRVKLPSEGYYEIWTRATNSAA